MTRSGSLFGSTSFRILSLCALSIPFFGHKVRVSTGWIPADTVEIPNVTSDGLGREICVFHTDPLSSGMTVQTTSQTVSLSSLTSFQFPELGSLSTPPSIYFFVLLYSKKLF